MNEKQLRTIAKSECMKVHGRDWDSMFSGDQEAEIESWISGYRYAVKKYQHCNASSLAPSAGSRHQ